MYELAVATISTTVSTVVVKVVVLSTAASPFTV